MANRRETLMEANALVNGSREDDYGKPSKNFALVAELWRPILGKDVTPAQVALCLLQLKVARILNTPEHEDSWIDAAGYVAIGAELATEGEE